MSFWPCPIGSSHVAAATLGLAGVWHFASSSQLTLARTAILLPHPARTQNLRLIAISVTALEVCASKQEKPAGGGFLLLGARRGQSAGADPRSRDSVLQAEPRHMSWVRTSRRASRWSATDRQRSRPGYSLRITDCASHIIGCSYAIASYFLINCMSTLIFWVAFSNLLVSVHDYFL